MSNLNQQQLGSYEGKHRVTGGTKAVPVLGSRSSGSPSVGAAEVHPGRQGPVHKFYSGKHAVPMGSSK
jgi:hypothetical protein